MHYLRCTISIFDYAASRTLVEYEIQLEDLQIGSVNNISRASLKFVFRRRMEFHVANTFLQVRIVFASSVCGRLLRRLPDTDPTSTGTRTTYKGRPFFADFHLGHDWLLVLLFRSGQFSPQNKSYTDNNARYSHNSDCYQSCK